jgi:hypothetical protein
MDESWMPAAAPPGSSAMAMPADRMSFVQDEAPDKNDRLLMFSMLGVVLMTILAFAIAHFNKPPAEPAQVVPAVKTAPAAGPATIVEHAPPVNPDYMPPESSAPAVSQDERRSTSPSPVRRYSTGNKSNPKLQLWRDAIAEH